MLEIDVWTIVWTIVNLLLLYAFLKKFLFGRVNAVLEKRKEMVQQEITEAQEHNRQAQALQDQYTQKLSGVAEEAAQKLADAQNRAQKIYDAKLAQADADVRKMRAEAESQIAAQREEMLRGARKEVGRLAILAAAKVAQKNLDDAADRAMAEAFLEEVGEGR